MSSSQYRMLSQGILQAQRVFLDFEQSPSGNYTLRQLKMTAAFTIFCHAEFESYMEDWARYLIDFAETQWKAGRATRTLVHLCTFHEGRGGINSVPQKDIWSEVIYSALIKHRNIIEKNNGIKEANFCEMFSPLGFDTTKTDSILLADLNAFGKMRGDYVHNSHRVLIGTTFDPFDIKNKVYGIWQLLYEVDKQLQANISLA